MMDKSARSTVAMVAAVIIAALAFVYIITCAGCSRTDEQPAMGDAGGRFVVVSNGQMDRTYWSVLEDTETGVQYLWCRKKIFRGGGCGLTPLLNPDGTPYTRENSSVGAEAYMPRRGGSIETGQAVA